jgi:IS605 OrfB family transposase
MQLSAQVKLQPTAEQKALLLRTLRAANAACNQASQVAWTTRTFRRFPLQKLCYQDLRARFGLGAQMAIRVLAKVADAYRLDRQTERTFRSRGSIAFDRRNLSWAMATGTVSLWTLEGRQRIPYVCGKRQEDLLARQHGETDLAYRDGTFYLLTSCEVPEASQQPVGGVLGVDVGLKNIAYDSDGRRYAGSHALGLRHRHRRLRHRLQVKHTKSAKRLLQKRSRRERRFMTDVNHCVSKQLVTTAEDTCRGIALEDLTGIRRRVSVRRHQRVTLHTWAFGQLRAFIEYKAALRGLLVTLVDPRNTSRTCPRCGHRAKANRKTQAQFSCVRCGFAGPADHIAAENIRRAAVNQPHAACDDVKAPHRKSRHPEGRTATERSCKPSASTEGC